MTTKRPLGQDDVHIWIVALDAREARRVEGIATLAPAERERAARFRSDLDRDSFVHRRCALRGVLSGYLGVSPRELAFSVNGFGKPSVIAPQPGAGLSFNASHSGAVAVIAVARSGRIGVDIERLRPLADAEDIARRCFAPGEAAAFAALGPQDRVEGFFNAWTRKEALVKALGAGLSIPLGSFEVSLRPHEPPAILRWDVPGADRGCWRIHRLEPAVGHVGALALDFRASACHCWPWPN